MRIRNPLVFRVVGKSILQTSLVVILFLDFFILHSIILVSLLWRFVRIIDTIYRWRNICQTTPIEEWEVYCVKLNKRVEKLSLPFAITHFVIIFLILFFISVVCSELLFEIEDRSRMFLNWWRQRIHYFLVFETYKAGSIIKSFQENLTELL